MVWNRNPSKPELLSDEELRFLIKGDLLP